MIVSEATATDSVLPPVTFIAVPLYDCRPDFRTAMAAFRTATNNKYSTAPAFFSSSALCMCFNALWAHAMVRRRLANVTHFAMVHSDVVPEPYWLDKLHDEMQATGADVVSCVIPIKNKMGITSTGLDTDYWRPRRLTMQEIYRLPQSFTAADVRILQDDADEHPDSDYDCPLLINTGCWLADLSKPWTEGVCFETDDRITYSTSDNGQPVCQVDFAPEDWNFSRYLAKQGAKVVATRKVKIEHMGLHGYHNFAPWGEAATDVGEHGIVIQ